MIHGNQDEIRNTRDVVLQGRVEPVGSRATTTQWVVSEQQSRGAKPTCKACGNKITGHSVRIQAQNDMTHAHGRFHHIECFIDDLLENSIAKPAPELVRVISGLDANIFQSKWEGAYANRFQCPSQVMGDSASVRPTTFSYGMLPYEDMDVELPIVEPHIPSWDEIKRANLTTHRVVAKQWQDQFVTHALDLVEELVSITKEVYGELTGDSDTRENAVPSHEGIARLDKQWRKLTIYAAVILSPNMDPSVTFIAKMTRRFKLISESQWDELRDTRIEVKPTRPAKRIKLSNTKAGLNSKAINKIQDHICDGNLRAATIALMNKERIQVNEAVINKTRELYPTAPLDRDTTWPGIENHLLLGDQLTLNIRDQVEVVIRKLKKRKAHGLDGWRAEHWHQIIKQADEAQLSSITALGLLPRGAVDFHAFGNIIPLPKPKRRH